MKLDKMVKSLMASASLAALMAATPLVFSFDQHDGLALKAAYAFADDDGDSGDNDDSGSGSDDDENEDEDNGDDEDEDDGEDEDEGEDEDGGNNNGDDDNANGDNDNANDDNEFTLTDGTKIEISADGLDIEIKYPDGTKEEIRNGQYERKDATNTTVEERPATDEDRARLQALIAG